MIRVWKSSRVPCMQGAYLLGFAVSQNEVGLCCRFQKVQKQRGWQARDEIIYKKKHHLSGMSSAVITIIIRCFALPLLHRAAYPLDLCLPGTDDRSVVALPAGLECTVSPLHRDVELRRSGRMCEESKQSKGRKCEEIH